MTTEFIIRILAATFLGAIIGLDREYRTKAAGFRTHVLVALGSALFMIISVHARIAAQVVTGIGFIGAGTIIFQKNVVKGLTTAAGLWVTAAVGMACGVGMYTLAAVSTVIVLLCFEAFNAFLHKMRGKREDEE